MRYFYKVCRKLSVGGGGMFQFNPSVNSIDLSGPRDVTHIPLSSAP